MGRRGRESPAAAGRKSLQFAAFARPDSTAQPIVEIWPLGRGRSCPRLAQSGPKQRSARSSRAGAPALAASRIVRAARSRRRALALPAVRRRDAGRGRSGDPRPAAARTPRCWSGARTDEQLARPRCRRSPLNDSQSPGSGRPRPAGSAARPRRAARSRPPSLWSNLALGRDRDARACMRGRAALRARPGSATAAARREADAARSALSRLRPGPRARAPRRRRGCARPARGRRRRRRSAGSTRRRRRRRRRGTRSARRPS